MFLGNLGDQHSLHGYPNLGDCQGKRRGSAQKTRKETVTAFDCYFLYVLLGRDSQNLALGGVRMRPRDFSQSA